MSSLRRRKTGSTRRMCRGHREVLATASAALLFILSCGESKPIGKAKQNTAGEETASPINASVLKYIGDPSVTPSSSETGDPQRAPDGSISVNPSVTSQNAVQLYAADVNDSMVGIQVKTLQQLRASVEACFGGHSSTLFKKDMFADHSFVFGESQAREFADQGRVRVFSSQDADLPSTYSVQYIRVRQGDSGSSLVDFIDPKTGENRDQPWDVLDIEAENLNDTSKTLRLNASADELTFRYLTSLEVLGKVVAHNCDLSQPECDCTSPDSAKAMIERCFATLSLDPAQLTEISQTMATQCSQSKLDQRRAIASLVSSYAFAVRR